MKNKRLNNKGITLIELIVSFVIVAVAVIYFYQMLTSVTKMYANTREGINHSAKVNYAFRLLDAAYDLNIELSDECPNALSDIATDCVQDEEDEFVTITFIVDEKEYTLYKYPEVLIDNTEDSEDIEDENIDEEEE